MILSTTANETYNRRAALFKNLSMVLSVTIISAKVIHSLEENIPTLRQTFNSLWICDLHLAHFVSNNIHVTSICALIVPSNFVVSTRERINFFFRLNFFSPKYNWVEKKKILMQASIFSFNLWAASKINSAHVFTLLPWRISQSAGK